VNACSVCACVSTFRISKRRRTVLVISVNVPPAVLPPYRLIFFSFSPCYSTARAIYISISLSKNYVPVGGESRNCPQPFRHRFYFFSTAVSGLFRSFWPTRSEANTSRTEGEKKIYKRYGHDGRCCWQWQNQQVSPSNKQQIIRQRKPLWWRRHYVTTCQWWAVQFSQFFHLIFSPALSATHFRWQSVGKTVSRQRRTTGTRRWPRTRRLVGIRYTDARRRIVNYYK